MTVRVLSKPVFQMVLRELRKTGHKVTKLSAGYVVHDGQGVQKLKAMQGTRGYLVRYDN